jgi:hypothetical protein
MKTGIEPPPGPKGVTAPDELQLHSFLLAPPGSMVAGLLPCQRGAILLDCGAGRGGRRRQGNRFALRRIALVFDSAHETGFWDHVARRLK